MRFTGVMAMIVVEDIDSALEFYRDALGFTVREQSSGSVLFEEGVSLQQASGDECSSADPPGRVMVSLLVEDARACYQELAEQGVPFMVPPTQEDGVIAAVFPDTEGNLLQLLQLE